jgi:hypothetical protein
LAASPKCCPSSAMQNGRRIGLLVCLHISEADTSPRLLGIGGMSETGWRIE